MRQYLVSIHYVCVPLVPVFFSWDLRIQHRQILSNQFSLFASYLFTNRLRPFSLGIVQHIKFDLVSVPLDLRQQAILFL